MHSQNKQQGFSLIEVLVSVIILSVGLLALAGFNGSLYKSVSYSSQRAQAISAAQLQIDNFRAKDFATLSSGADAGDCTSSTPHRIWTISNVAGISNVKNMLVYACWTDANGVKQEMSISTQIGITTAAATATPAPTSTPTVTATPAPCTANLYVANAAYADGAVVKNIGSKFTCKVAGWCSGAASAYAPGTGWAWDTAWTKGEKCD